MAAGEIKILLKFAGFDMDGGVEIALTHAYIDVQKCDFRGKGVPSEMDGKIAAFEAFKELCEEVGTMRPKEENVIDKTQPEAGFLESGVRDPVQGYP